MWARGRTCLADQMQNEAVAWYGRSQVMLQNWGDYRWADSRYQTCDGAGGWAVICCWSSKCVFRPIGFNWVCFPACVWWEQDNCGVKPNHLAKWCVTPGNKTYRTKTKVESMESYDLGHCIMGGCCLSWMIHILTFQALHADLWIYTMNVWSYKTRITSKRSRVVSRAVGKKTKHGRLLILSFFSLEQKSTWIFRVIDLVWCWQKHWVPFKNTSSLWSELPRCSHVTVDSLSGSCRVSQNAIQLASVTHFVGPFSSWVT